MSAALYLGVDVGSTSARAGLFDAAGALKGTGKAGFETFRDSVVAEQSSADIWRAVCEAVRASLAEAEAVPGHVGGVGFDAACSLVVLDEAGGPISVGEDPARDVIVWMDQRATDQAARINAGEHAVLAYVGGRISPEMQTPKLLWLREERPESYDRAARFFDLADYLTFRATGDETRSTCTVTCKWTYLAHEERWDADYFRAIGLGDIPDGGFARIGSRVAAPGTPLGNGLTEAAAKALGLALGTPVAAGLIDAHAGGLGTVGGPGADPLRRMAYVFGTSACTMSSSTGPVFVPGVWGPYHSAMVPGLWLLEGGQSAAGAAIEALIAMHPARAEAEALAGDMTLPDWLSARAVAMAGDVSAAADLVGPRLVVPDFAGNRAPLADPNRRAVIAGLGLEEDVDALVRLYVAGLSGLGYGLRQILDVQRDHGLAVDEVVISGGAGADPLVRRIMADAADIPVAIPRTPEPVLLGAAILGAIGACRYETAQAAMAAMCGDAESLSPNPEAAEGHAASYKRFLALQDAAAP
ncbi:MAG: FGGY-family carbohydrate kinase [Pseudomonadota bacterium]